MKKTKLLVVGWDGADWKVINRLVEQGKMPTIARVIDSGTIGNIATLDPPFSPMLWTTIATGKYPFKHGVLGFSEPLADMSGVQPISSLSRKTKAVWNILTQNGYFCNVVNWWPSHPAEPINGFMVSNFFKAIKDFKFQPLPQGTVHPPEFAEFFNHLRLLLPEISGEMLLPLVPQAREILEKNPKRLQGITENLATTFSVHNVATWLMENTSWEFMAVYYDIIDHMSHGFMQYYPPRLPHIPEEDYELFNQVVEGTYILQDYMLGALLDLAGDDVNLILLSDHGFHSDHLRPRAVPSEPAGPAYQHRNYGILLLHGPLFKQDERIYGASLLDITPTILYAYGLPVGQDMDGVPLVNAFRQPTEIKTVPSWDKIPGQDGRHNKSAAESNYDRAEILQQLIDLGYIEKPDSDGFRAAQKTQRELNYNLARSYMFANLFDKAALILQDLFDQEPHLGRFAIRLATCYERLSDPDRAWDVIKTFDQKLAEYTDNLTKEISELSGKIQQLHQSKDKDEKELSRLQERLSDKRRALQGARKDKYLSDIFKASLYSDQKEYNKALDLLLGIKEKIIPNPDFLSKIAEIYILKKDFASAEKFLQQAYDLDPENANVLYQLGYVAFLQNHYQLALDYLLQSATLLYYNYRTQYLLGLTLKELGEYERAALALEVTLLIAPNFTRARNILIDLYEKHLNNPEKAEHHRKYFTSPQEFISDFQEQILDQPDDLRVKPETKAIAQASDKDPIIVVSGIPRSGTSLMMQILEQAGIEIFTDHKREKDENNPRGYYEHEAVKKIAQQSDFLDNLSGKAVKIVSHLLPYLPDKHVYKILFMERNLDEIVRSQLKMIERLKGEKKEYRYFQLKNHLTIHLHRIKQWISRQSNIQVLYVSYHDLIDNPEQIVWQVAEFLNIPPNKIPAMVKVIDPSLHRTKFNDKK